MDNKTSNFYQTVLYIILGFSSFTICLTIFCSYICYKKKPSYYDKLIQQKYLLQTIFYLILFSFMIYYSIQKNEIPGLVRLISKIAFDDYLIIFYCLHLFLYWERYSSICNPNLLLKQVLQQSYSFFYYDLILLIVSGAYGTFFYISDFFKTKDIIFVAHTYFLSIILLTISLSSSIILILIYCFKLNLENKTKSNYQITNGIMLIDIILFISYGIAMLMSSKFSEEIATLLILCFCLLDSLLTFKMIYSSSFYYYYLGNSVIGSMYICCGCKRYSKPFRIGDSYYSNDRDLFLYNLYTEIGYILDDYVIDNFDYLINASLAGLTKVYKNLKDDKVTFSKNDPKLDIRYFDVNSMNIQIETLFGEKVKQIMNKYHVTTQMIITSFLSNNYTSLLNKSSKNQYFQNLKSLCFKTGDNKLLLEIQSDYKFNDQRRRFIDRYFDHLNSNHAHTFLPALIGIFIIQIDSFRPFALFVSVNPLIENFPKEHFNYWELMHFPIKDKEPQKISTSKEKESLKITTELIFKENAKFQIEEFQLFQDILNKDLFFFKVNRSKDFSMIILYYEMEKSSKEKNENNLLIPDDFTKSLIVNNEDIDKSINLVPGKSSDISMITYRNDFSKTSLPHNGFDCTYNKFQGVLFFSFGNILNDRSSFPQGNLYHNYLDKVTSYFNNSE